MKFAYTRLVTEDVATLAAFYEELTGTAPVGAGDYVEFRLDGAWLALCSRQAAEFMHGGSWPGASNGSAILEFQVTDVDAEFERLERRIKDWIQTPKDMPWGNRSMIFRDPEGNPVNLFTPPASR